MSRELYAFSETIAPGSTPAAPVVLPLTMPARRVDRIEIVVPPGPQGQVGFALGFSGQAVLPVNAGAFIVSDNERIVWDVDGYPNSGAWQLIAYNTGVLPHTLQLRFLVELVTGPTGQSPIAGVSNAELAAVPDAALAVTSDTAPIDLTGLTLTVPDTLTLAGM